MILTVSYTSLEPGPLKSIGVESPSFDGTDISLLSTSTFLFMFSFTLIIGAVFFQLVRASLVRMGAGVTEDAISRSNKMYKGAVYGLIGLLALSLIFFTVNKDMISGDVGLQALKVNGVSVVGSNSAGTSASSTSGGIPSSTGSGSGSGADAIRNDPSVRAQLARIGITVNKPVCPDPNAEGCTTVGGVPDVTISMLGSLRQTCGGSIEVTGGTEKGHKSHGPGLTPIDISFKDGALNGCVEKFSSGPNLGYCKRTFTNFGFIFCDEKSTEPHWHIFR